MKRTPLMDRLGLRVPIVLSPMGGGQGTPALAAAVCSEGGLGALGCAYETPEVLRAQVRAARALSAGPLAVNLFVPERLPAAWSAAPVAASGADPAQADAARAALAAAISALRPFTQVHGLPDPALPAFAPFPFDAQLSALLDEAVEVFTFTFGIPPPAALQQCRSRGVFIIGTATTVAEGRALEAAGVDAISAQGAEAGAHRGSFLAPGDVDLVGTFALVPQLVDAVRVPVIAAGGIMDGRGVAAALALGAQAAQLGTAFLLCPEAGTSAPYRAALAAARDDSTAITRAFTGKPARGIRNQLLRALAPLQQDLPPFPLQHALTKALRAAGARAGDPEVLSLWAGQGVGLSRALPAAELVRRLVEEADAALARL